MAGLPVALVTCSSCHFEKDPKKCVKKNSKGANGSVRDTFVCHECHALVARVTRWVEKNDLDFSMSAMTEEGRLKFCQANQGKFKDSLAKVITEAITVLSVQRSSQSFTCASEYVDFTDAEITFKSKPIEWKEICANASRMQCPVRKVEMIAIPKFSSRVSEEQIHTLENKRKMEQEDQVKKVKKAKVEKVLGESGDAEGIKMLPLLDKQQTKLDSQLGKLERESLKLAAIQSTASATELKEYVSPAALRKGEAVREQMKDSLTHIFLNLGF